MIMHHPLPITYCEGVILGYLQIIHRLGPRHHLPARHHTHTPIRPQNVHAQLDLTHRQKAMLQGEERVFLVGMHHFTRFRDLATRPLRRGGHGQVHQIMVMVDPHVQDGLLLHLTRLGVVRQHLLADVQRADLLFAMVSGDTGG